MADFLDQVIHDSCAGPVRLIKSEAVGKAEVWDDCDTDLDDRSELADDPVDSSSSPELPRRDLVCASKGASRHALQSLRCLSFRHFWLGAFAAQFLHTTLAHFLHSATRSLAHCPIFLFAKSSL